MSLRIERNYQDFQTADTKKSAMVNKDNIVVFDFIPDNNQEKQVSTDERKRATRERYKAIKDKRLVYHEEKADTTYFLGFIKRTNYQKAYYEYKADGKETLYQIKHKFGIRPHGLESFNQHYNESEEANECIPDAGTIIYFYEYEIE